MELGLLSREEFDAQKLRILSDPPSSVTVADTPTGPDIGQTLGAYRLQERIGTGGMGTVLRGRHRSEIIAASQGGDVAIKVMHPHLVTKPEFEERFQREAETGHKLDHPQIVRVLELIEDGGMLAMVLELVEGKALSTVLGAEQEAIPWRRALPLFLDILEPVAFAHARGVVHRDLKPDNILLPPGEKPKILDFGIAKDVEHSKTRTGATLGTPRYMAPEQFQDAKAVDARADTYALGMTLYEMVAGRLPWPHGTPEFHIMTAKVRGEIPDPRRFCAALPAGLVEVLCRAVAAPKEERFQSVEELREALLAFLESDPASEVLSLVREAPPTSSSAERIPAAFEATHPEGAEPLPPQVAPVPAAAPAEAAPSDLPWVFLILGDLALLGLLLLIAPAPPPTAASEHVVLGQLRSWEQAQLRLDGVQMASFYAPVVAFYNDAERNHHDLAERFSDWAAGAVEYDSQISELDFEPVTEDRVRTEFNRYFYEKSTQGAEREGRVRTRLEWALTPSGWKIVQQSDPQVICTSYKAKYPPCNVRLGRQLLERPKPEPELKPRWGTGGKKGAKAKGKRSRQRKR
jgi:serine/threonine protein kinase